MRSDGAAISAVSDALGLGAAKVDTAYAGLESVVEVLSEVKAKIVAAQEEGVDKAKIQAELDQLKAQVVSIAQSASFAVKTGCRRIFKTYATTPRIRDLSFPVSCGIDRAMSLSRQST